MSRAFHLVQLVKARGRKPAGYKVTFFSERDEWWFDGILDARICPACEEMNWVKNFKGTHLRREFPYLMIIDPNTIGGPAPGGRGLVHPHCRCRLRRKTHVWNV